MINVGPRAAINIVSADRPAKKLGWGKTICRVICDEVDRYEYKFHNTCFLKQNWLSPSNYLNGRYKLSFL